MEHLEDDVYLIEKLLDFLPMRQGWFRADFGCLNSHADVMVSYMSVWCSVMSSSQLTNALILSE